MEYNILYFAFVSNIFGGVEQKVIAQHDALFSLNKSAKLFLVSTYEPGEKLNAEIQKRENITTLINSESKRTNPFFRRKEKFQMMENEITKYSPVDTVIYLRYPNADYIFLLFLKNVQHYKIITEHQEIENTFTKGIFNGNYLRNIFEFIWGKEVRTLLAGFVGVTPEITAFELLIAKQPDKSSLTNGNGIQVEKYPVRQPILEIPGEIKILFVGAGYRTHGLHRLLKSMANYNKQQQHPKYTILLKVAGDSNEMLFNKKLVVKFDLQQHVDFVGHCEGETLNQLYNWADVAVGSLGIHRKGLIYTSELKAREYYSRGIPFFWSTIDQDLPENNPFVYQLEANEELFSMHEIIEFVLRIRGWRSHPSEMRTYSENNLDWRIKMRILNNFLINTAKFSLK